MAYPLDIVQRSIGSSWATGQVLFTLSTPAIEGDILIVASSTRGSSNTIDTVLADGAYLSLTQLFFNPLPVGVINTYVNIVVAPLPVGATNIVVNPTSTNEWFVDITQISNEARILPYEIDYHISIDGETPFQPATTREGEGIMLAYGWTDGSSVTSPGDYSVGSFFLFDFTYWYINSNVQPPGPVAQDDWIGTIDHRATTLQIVLNAEALLVKPGISPCSGGATILSPSSPENGLFTSRVPPTLHAVPPTPTQPSYPIAPWTKRPGRPYRSNA